MAISPDDPRLQKAGFARLVGRGIDYTLRKYECTMGRKSKAKNVDLELGDTMSISRKHACISYNFEKGIRLLAFSVVFSLCNVAKSECRFPNAKSNCHTSYPL